MSTEKLLSFLQDVLPALPAEISREGNEYRLDFTSGERFVLTVQRVEPELKSASKWAVEDGED